MNADLSPRQIVQELDRFIVGQQEAKKAVAIALRNHWRRQQVAAPLRDEIVPKNILMIGPTGVGKTEIARRLARLANAPFIKVEATKFTEVGYVGRDVDSIIRDLVESAILLLREEHRESARVNAQAAVEERLLDVLVGKTAGEETRNRFRDKLRKGELDDKVIEIELPDNAAISLPSIDIPGSNGGQMGFMNLSELLGKAGGRRKLRKLSVKESQAPLLAEESDKLLDQEKIVGLALERVEQNGIVFIDEIDKVAARQEMRGAEVSREGVQRDLLPLIEGTAVSTKYGVVKTDHILFIASGAFHMARPSDLLPELQGRLPIRVELNALSEADMRRILEEPECSLLKQYAALLAVEGVEVAFAEDGIAALARLATQVNKDVENIGARRLHTIMERLLQDVSFHAADYHGQQLVIDTAYVQEHVGSLAENADLSRFIL